MVNINITIDGETWQDCMKQLRGAINPDSHNHVVHCAPSPEKPSEDALDAADKPQNAPEHSGQADTPQPSDGPLEASEAVQKQAPQPAAEEKKKRGRKPAQEKQAENPTPQVEEFVPDFPPSDSPCPAADLASAADQSAAPKPAVNRNAISNIAADWMRQDPSHGTQLRELLKKYNVNALTRLPEESLQDFAEDLRQLGVNV